MAFAFAAFLVSTPARADEAADEKARGDAAMDAGRAAEALAAYDHAALLLRRSGGASLGLTPALDYNRGRAMLAMGDFAGALGAFESFSATAPPELLDKTSRLPDIMAELRAKITELTITCVSCGADATFTVRGLPVTTDRSFRVNPGPATLVVTSRGYEPFAETLELRAGQPQSVAVRLTPEPKTGLLILEGAPSGARSRVRVSVDGGTGRPNEGRLELSPGPHEIEISADDYEPRRVSVVVERGKERHVPAALKKRAPSLTSRPWFWAALGVLAATGLTVAVVAGTQERGLDQGTLGTFRVP